ncbi:DUF6731 family protein [Tepidibacter thalassicus]|uniref:Uncharacterized protein n=1 Tax=Tepidibacter thalassicus DSM 15285 TaxID=1123350 RepID=A0A1M5PVM6_9FIRM|nr:DUF6731 family protein [Tepidibacter thalassicus]SHH05686.1 hypothetical protein SAMN02744040_00621 [Tepidibacter thalassicus DSM 15285]
MANKYVQFDYFQIFCAIKNENGDIIENRYDITGILEKASTLTAKDTTQNYRGEKARIQTVKYHDSDKVWEIQFLRLRENCPPGIADEDGEYEIIALDDDKYVGEFASALYDKEECILVFHRNRNSLTPSGIEEYLNKVIDNKNILIKLKPIISRRDVKEMLKGKIYRTISFGLSTDDLNEINEESHLGGLLKSFLKYKGANLKVEIYLGNVKRDRTLAPGLIDEAIDELHDLKATSKLEVKFKNNPDTITEKVDLLNDRVKDTEKFEVDKQNPLTHEKVYPILKRCYLKRKNNNDIF